MLCWNIKSIDLEIYDETLVCWLQSAGMPYCVDGSGVPVSWKKP